jgi:hypothetical protein
MERNAANHEQDQPAENERLRQAFAAGYGALFVAFVLVIAVAIWLRVPYGRIRYAPGFSEAAFSSIRFGDTELHVLKTLGEPLSRSRGGLFPGEVLWHYCEPGSASCPSGTHAMS